VHYAGHTNFLQTDPALSHFLLADGPLNVTELTQFDLHSQALFYLSSCESAQAGRQSDFGNVLGLSAVLMMKGAGGVVGSNWIADDNTSLTLAQLFYTHLLGGETMSAALRAARASLFERGERASAWALAAAYGHPFLRVHRRG
jgi:CHAT domain-containing protein